MMALERINGTGEMVEMSPKRNPKPILGRIWWRFLRVTEEERKGKI